VPVAERVVQVLGPSTGGIRRVVGALSGGLAGLGWEVRTAGPAGVLEGVAHQDHTVTWSDRRGLRRVIDGADVVHAHGLKVGWALATIRRRPPLVVSVHNLVLDEAAGRAAPVLRFLEGQLPRRADRTVALSAEVARRFSGLPGADRVVVIPPATVPPERTATAAEVRRRWGVADGEHLLVTVARLHPQKGLPMLLDAVGRLAGVRLAIVGEGPDRASLAAEIERRRLPVVLTGQLPSAADLLGAADVVVVPSLWESGPLVLVEAMLLGRPVVSTPVGFARQLVVDGETGRLVPGGDPDALAAAIEATLSDPDGARGMAEAGRRRAASRHSVAALAAAHDALYRELLP
jgi:glycosyltransferase involved in cell wall biosynthesis